MSRRLVLQRTAADEWRGEAPCQAYEEEAEDVVCNWGRRDGSGYSVGHCGLGSSVLW